ncbi:hypothetical protein D6833_12830 [Candidatus Parcubacteria bacterium]|nr:MAG: hypothetical protein D6833_12830 [Candidatus Parcubacteria bacterium]
MSELNMELRKKGVTGSEIAAVAGLNPWKSPVEVWEEKVGLREPPEQNFHMERGTYLESGLIKWLEAREGYRVDPVPTLQSKQHELVIASPDGAAHEPEGDVLLAAVEVKCPSTSRDWEDPEIKPDGIPIYYLPQTIWEMAVLEIDRCDVAALLKGDLKVYRISWNQQLFEALLRKAEEFWKYVEREEPPPLDHTEASRRLLERFFPREKVEELKESPRELEPLVLEYRSVRQQLDELDKQRKLLENRIKQEIGEAAGLVGPWGKITWKATKDRQTIDLKALRAEAPEVAERFTVTKPGSRVFRVTWRDEE